jgi:hypothetical protein
MKRNAQLNRIRSILVACLIAGTTSAVAAPGYSLTSQQGEQIKVGMGTAEVLRLIGRPVTNITYRNEPGPLWTYWLIGTIDPWFFSVTFGADGKVVATHEFQDLTAYGAP